MIKKSLICLMIIWLISCTTNSGNWRSGLPKLESNDKDYMIIFTGSDWDENSKNALDKLFTKKFFSKFSKDFNIYNIDIVRDKNLMPANQLSKNYVYFSEYGVDNLPFIVLETSERDAYLAQDFISNSESLNEFSLFIQNNIQKREQILEARTKIKNTNGADKTIAIDEFLNLVENADSAKYDYLRKEALASDPENNSGLKAKYILINADIKASKLASQKDFKSAANIFLEITNLQELANEEKQAAYYYAAYMLAMSEEKKNTVKQLLETALKLAPNNELAIEIQKILSNLKK